MATLTPVVNINLDLKRDEINTEHDKAITSLIRVGDILRDVQQQIDDMTFKSFVTTLSFSRSSAYNYMRLSEHVALHGSPTVGHALVSASVWYTVKPTDSETVKAITDKVQRGKKVSKQDVQALIDARSMDNPKLNNSLLEASNVSPNKVAGMLIDGITQDIDGNDIPLDEADSTVIHINTNEHAYESVQRQKNHISENSTAKQKLTGTLELVTDKHGVVYMAFQPSDSQSLPVRLSGKQVTIYYEDDNVIAEDLAA